MRWQILVAQEIIRMWFIWSEDNDRLCELIQLDWIFFVWTDTFEVFISFVEWNSNRWLCQTSAPCEEGSDDAEWANGMNEWNCRVENNSGFRFACQKAEFRFLNNDLRCRRFWHEVRLCACVRSFKLQMFNGCYTSKYIEVNRNNRCHDNQFLFFSRMRAIAKLQFRPKMRQKRRGFQ